MHLKPIVEALEHSETCILNGNGYNISMKIELPNIKPTVVNALKTVNQRQYVVENNHSDIIQDHVVIEEPLLISLTFINNKSQRQSIDLTVIMRTPGFDEELIVGFLFSEHIITFHNDIVSMKLYDDVGSTNHIEVVLADHISVDWQSVSRNFPSQSSCGICGKSSLNALSLKSNLPVDAKTSWLKTSEITQHAHQLKNHQPLFNATGGVHGAAYIAQNEWLCVYEDVGRHNAVDKIIGDLCLSDRFASQSILVLSGRVSFELIQKAITSGIAVIIAIGAPSSLAVSAAIQFNITLIGFTKETQFNVYSGNQRINESC